MHFKNLVFVFQIVCTPFLMALAKDATDSTSEAGIEWGSFTRNKCIDATHAQYTSRLWNIPSGQDWMVTCLSTPARINAEDYPTPDECQNTGLTGIWGLWNIPDATCSNVNK